jgi:hypothetical protein
VSGRFSDVGADLVEAIREDAQRLERVGEPWGRDEEGEEFARHYEPAAEQAMRALVMVARSLPEIGVRLQGMAQSVLDNERNTAHQLVDPSRPVGAGTAGITSLPLMRTGGSLSAAVGYTPGDIERVLDPQRYASAGTEETPSPAATAGTAVSLGVMASGGLGGGPR